MNIQEKNWELTFQICFKTVQDNEIIWLQYRVLHRILGTQYILKKIGKAESSLCLQCNNFTETLIHLFYHCHKSQIIWNELKTWIKNAINFALNIQPRDIRYIRYFSKSNPRIFKEYFIWVASSQRKVCTHFGTDLNQILKTRTKSLNLQTYTGGCLHSRSIF